MKTIKYFIIALIIANYFSCNKCEELILEPCGEYRPNTEYSSYTVTTQYAHDGGFVGEIFDTRFNSTAPSGDDWATTTSAPQVNSFTPANWSPDSIGQVFGIAIDDKDNIYLGSSDIYLYGSGLPSNTGRPFSPGQIFKCSPSNSFNAVPFAVLPNSGGNFNGIGNIAFDRWNKQLFATNLEDGKIYRIDMAGSIIETYDPWSADVPATGVVSQKEQAWGIGVNEENGLVKVYFPRISNSERSIYSITLVNGAFPAPSTEVREIANVPGVQLIISDIAFSSDKQKMLIAERNHPHASLVISYNLSGPTWNFYQQYFVGGQAGNDGENSAGGVDFAYSEVDSDISAVCDEFFWATGNYMDARNSSLNKIYGIQGMLYSGNNSTSAPITTANQDTDLFIDFDGLGTTGFKGTIGDVEVFDCPECFDPCEEPQF